jgi:hypothetical protein
MACGNNYSFIKVGVYYLRSDKITAIKNNGIAKEGEQESITVFYDSPILKSITHVTADKTDEIIAALCGAPVYDPDGASVV